MTKPKTRPKAPLGATLVVFSSFFYASYGIWTKLIGSFLGGYTASTLRSVLVLVFLAPVALVAHKFEPLNWPRNGKYIIGMLIASLFTWGPLFYAILHAGVGLSLTISYVGIIIGSFVFGWLFAGETYTRDKFYSTLLSFVGLWLVFSPSVEKLGWLALAAAGVSGLSAGLNGTMAKKLSYNATYSTIMLWSTSVVANVFMALLIHESWPASGWHIEWLWLMAFAVASVAASWSFVRGVKLIDVGAAGILGLLEIVFGVLFGVVVFGEHLSLTVLVGVAVIFAAASIPYIKDFNAESGKLEGN